MPIGSSLRRWFGCRGLACEVRKAHYAHEKFLLQIESSKKRAPEEEGTLPGSRAAQALLWG